MEVFFLILIILFISAFFYKLDKKNNLLKTNNKHNRDFYFLKRAGVSSKVAYILSQLDLPNKKTFYYKKELSDEEKNLAGQRFELFVGKFYENNGYVVEYRGIELGKKDGGIDLIAKKDNQIILIQCKNWKDENSITHNHIKEFYGNCNFFIDKNLDYKRENILCIFACTDFKVLDNSVKYLCKETYSKCRYKVFQDYYQKQN